MGHNLWHLHPHVRSGDDLTFGEKAADRMRDGFGSWSFIGATILFLAIWIGTVEILQWKIDNSQLTILNLILSCFAAMQGAIILLAAKRADAVAAQLATAHYSETSALEELVRANKNLTEKVDQALQANTTLTQQVHQILNARSAT